MFVDIEWEPNTVRTYKQRVERVVGAVGDLIAMEGEGTPSPIDDWLLSRFHSKIKSIDEAMAKNDLRAMATTVYFDMLNDIKWYNRRGGNNRETINAALRIWIQSMMPITPHVAEELWEQAGFEGFVSTSELTTADESMISASAEYGENFLRDLMSDIGEIRKIAGIEPTKLVLYTTAKWKRDVMAFAVEMLEEGKLTVPDLTKRCMQDEAIKKNGKAASEMAKKIAVEFVRSTPESKRPVFETDEYALISNAIGFLSEEIKLPVEVYSADTEGVYDPANKARAAAPGRPAIYLE
jgi:leucyl-tRNA synthetase